MTYKIRLSQRFLEQLVVLSHKHIGDQRQRHNFPLKRLDSFIRNHHQCNQLLIRRHLSQMVIMPILQAFYQLSLILRLPSCRERHKKACNFLDNKTLIKLILSFIVDLVHFDVEVPPISKWNCLVYQTAPPSFIILFCCWWNCYQIMACEFKFKKECVSQLGDQFDNLHNHR